MDQNFAACLKNERQRCGLSLRQLAEKAGLNPGYLSRLESAEVTPLEKNVLKIADALAMSVDDRLETRERFRKKLAEVAGRGPNSQHKVEKIRHQFSERLAKEGLQEKQIASALKSVSVLTMARVVRGEEPLEIRPFDRIIDFDVRRNRDQETVVIPDFEHNFKAGDRASITVKGALRPEQQTQIRLIAKLIRNIVGET
jgi:transcriptional regulator with XRE-family HTH domain